ncbi:MAG TPA: hypothetical protein VGX78_22300, partial [Pirellulales bacterium]|jgi:hypothetical protein|nr:hypothetical protein [Pirellulales bacterium]
VVRPGTTDANGLTSGIRRANQTHGPTTDANTAAAAAMAVIRLRQAGLAEFLGGKHPARRKSCNPASTAW